VKFLARGGGYGLFLTANEAALTLQHPAVSGPQSASRTSIIRMALDGANENAVVVGTDELPGKSNYFVGNNPSKWHRNVPQFAGVRYQNVYPGVDLVYYGNQGRLEYDFEVAPGADPNQVALRFGATGKLKLDAQGNLAIVSGEAEIRFEAPRVYQRIGQERQPVAGRFILHGENRVKFELGAYDRSRALVIDPVLAYSTYLGGKGNEACSAILPSGLPTSGCPAIAVDSSGSIYIAGSTTSVDFPLTPAPVPPATGPLPFQACLDHPDKTPPCPNDLATSDAFIAKINPSASPASAQLVFSTYLGGSGSETTAGVAVDSGFNVIVAGNTNSGDFPTDGALNAFQATPEVPGSHVFVSKIDATGATLIYSTYLSGNGTDTATGLAVDIKGKAYVTGTTTSTDTPSAAPPTAFPATIGAFQTMSLAKPQFFVSKIDPALAGFSSLVYSTYFGGGTTASNAPIVANGGGIAVDVNSVVYFTGGTNFFNTGSNSHVAGGNGTDFPILNAYQLCLDTPKNPTTPCSTSGATFTDIFLAKLDPSKSSGAQLLYSTYLGGTSNDVGYGVAVDSGTNAYLTGSTTSTDFNFTPATGVTVFQGSNAGATDAFVAKIGPPCTTTTTTCPQGTVPLLYFTYLGGSGTDVGLGITVDSIQGAQVTGYTTSTNFPHLNNPIQTTLAGPQDAFVTRIDTTATTATAAGHFSTYLGGAGNDAGTSIALDVQNFTYVGGETFSHNFPPAPPPAPNPFQGALDGTSDAFIAKLGPFLNLKVSETASPNHVGVGNQVSFIYTIVNNGDLTTGITFADTFSSTGVNFVSASSSPGSCGTALAGSVTCSVGTLNGGASATVTVILIPTVGGPLSDGGKVTVFGSPRIFTPPVPAVATVSDFSISVPFPTATVPAGTPATYSVLVSPGGPFPDTVTLSVSGTFPAGVTQSFPSGSSVDLSSGAQSRLLVLNSQMRVTTPASLWRRGGAIYAALIPLSGMALLGVGLGSLGTGRKGSRRRLLMQALVGAFLTLVLFQAGCGTTASTPTTTGTPVGNYLFTVTGTSGPVSHTQQIFLDVK
jgi:hypothetical protein